MVGISSSLDAVATAAHGVAVVADGVSAGNFLESEDGAETDEFNESVFFGVAVGFMALAIDFLGEMLSVADSVNVAFRSTGDFGVVFPVSTSVCGSASVTSILFTGVCLPAESTSDSSSICVSPS